MTNKSKREPNFISVRMSEGQKSERWALVKCFECDRENYAFNVLRGVCVWCGFDINGCESSVDIKSK
jgi:hypothetical protein